LVQEASYAYVAKSGPYLQKRLPAWAAPFGALAGALIDFGRGALLHARLLSADLSCEWQEKPPAALDELWSGRLQGLECGIGVRDRQYLSWRFGMGDWRTAVVTARGNARPVAYMICRRTNDELVVAD